MLRKPRFESETINAFYEFLLKNGLKESTCNDYCRRILAICKQFQITPEELFKRISGYSIDDLIGMYSNHPEMKAENAKKHGAPLSALKRFKKFTEARRSGHLQNKIVETIYIKFAPLYQSFAITDKHIGGFTIQDRHFELVYEQNRRVCDIVEKQISDKNFSDLIAVMRRYKNYLNDDKKSAREMFPNGGASAIEYCFEDKQSVFGGVWHLFVGGKTADKANAEFGKIIENIINQPGGKSVFVSAVPAGNSVPVPTVPATGKTDIMADEFWRDFAEFLRNAGLKESTIQCYIKQSVKKCLETYFGMSLSDFSALGNEEKCNVAQELHAILNDAKSSSKDAKTKKKLQDYNSAVLALIAYLSERTAYSADDAYTPGAAPVVSASAGTVQIPAPSKAAAPAPAPSGKTPPVVPPSGKGARVLGTGKLKDTYTYDELYKIFDFRVMTQDRNYKNIYLPCRLFDMIFSGNADYMKLMKSFYDEIVFLLDHGRKVTFKKIKEITFDNGFVWVILNSGEKEQLYTEVYRKGNPAGFEKMQTNVVSDLTLDHDVPLKILLSKVLGSYPLLKKLSDSCVRYRDSFPVFPGKWELAAGFFRTEYAALNIDDKELLKELCSLYRRISITIMQKKYNCSKNSNVNNQSGPANNTSGNSQNNSQIATDSNP